MATLSEHARTFLNETHFAVLATISQDGMPQQTTMWYLLEGETIVMNTKAGRLKDQNMRRDPRISICVEDGYRYVTICGTVTMIDDPEISQRDIYRLALRYSGEQGAARQMVETFSQEHRVTLHLRCERVHEYL